MSTRYNIEVAETEAARGPMRMSGVREGRPYLDHDKGYPSEIHPRDQQQSVIVMGTRHSNQFINTCAMCGLCAEVCPTDVNMGEVCHEARHDGGTKGCRHRRTILRCGIWLFSNGGKFALAHNAPGLDTSSYVFLAGR
ncbi:MAG: 4Fe-4S dicluster domain-containing protein [Anaerolineales bacterium]|nr:4Fe-4S dicluster domain-containing protein [Anaerolineales bacterium]